MSAIVNKAYSFLRSAIKNEVMKINFNKMMTSIYAVMIFVTLSYTPAMPIAVAIIAEMGTIAGVVYFGQRSINEEKEKIK